MGERERERKKKKEKRKERKKERKKITVLNNIVNINHCNKEMMDTQPDVQTS
jgi:hypothetical protein